MKETSLDCQRRVDAYKQLIQYQIFIKNSRAKTVLQKTSLRCKIKMKSVLKIMKQQLRAVSPKQPFT